MVEDKIKGPIRRLFMAVANRAATLAWTCGQLDVALEILKGVREDARENLQRVPNHKLSRAADERLSRAIAEVEEIAGKLAAAASGEEDPTLSGQGGA